MRLASGEYLLADLDFSVWTEIDLLAHFNSPELPNRGDYHRLRTTNLVVDHGIFIYYEHKINVIRHHQKTTVSCTCRYEYAGLCPHEMVTLAAILHINSYRPFFDQQARQHLFLSYAYGYGLQYESDLDRYFVLEYDKGSLMVYPKNKSILAVERHNLLPLPKSQRSNLQSKHRILVMSKHRFYNQLRFEIIDTDITTTGKPKTPFDFVDPTPLLWKTKNTDAVKFYAAIAGFKQNYTEDNVEQDLGALQIITQNPLNLPFYYHDISLSEKVNSKSLIPSQIRFLEASIELSVLKLEPFYEIKGELVWHEQRIPLKKLNLQQNYFLKKEDAFYLIRDVNLFRLIEFFKKSPDTLLVHHNKYEEFLQYTLQPLEKLIHINYSYIRPASGEEEKEIMDDRERLIYFSQEGSYINITPVMRYANIEVPISSRNRITAKDANGNLYYLDRDLNAEDKLRTIIIQQHADFADQIHELDYFYLHHHQFLDDHWFITAFEAWRNEGITLLGFQKLNVTNINPYKAQIDIKIISGTDWFNTKIALQYGDQEVSIKQLHKAIRHKSKYIQLDDGTLGILPEEWINKIAKYFQWSVLEKDLLKIPKIHFADMEDLFDKNAIPKEIEHEINILQHKISHVDQIPPVKIPPALRATLRPYQHEGLSWLNQLDEFNFGGCLADDMGLGKTVQMIAFLLLQKEKHPDSSNLIVAPTSLIFNWQQELSKFAPSLRVLTLHGPKRKKYWDSIQDYDIVLTSYGHLLTDIGKFRLFHFNCITLDESQAIKNPNAERNKAAQLLQARNRFVLSGTPIENNTYDLYGQLSFACPGLLGNQRYFRDTFATPIDRFQDRNRAKQLQQKTTPFILRRTKTQVAKELPEKTEMTIYCEMGETQRDIYNTYEAELRDYLNGKDDVDKDSIHILAGLTRLRQICNAPHLLKEGYDSAISSKIEAILEQLETIAVNHKVLIFSQFVEMLDLVKDALEKQSIPYEYLTGGTKNREQTVNRFQRDDTVRVFLISLKAGGVGLNLTAADYVFLIDPWWNPAIENQAIDRSYRIGQNKPVVAIRFICPDTIEEKIQVLQDKKKHLAADMVHTDQDVLQKFSRKDWLSLLH